MKKLLAFLMVLCMVLAAFSGCGAGQAPAGSGGEEKERVEISVMLPPWSEITDPALIEQFTEETGIVPNITIVGWDAIHDKVTIASVSETAAADVFEVDWSWVTEFATIGCVEPLEFSDDVVADVPLFDVFSYDGKIIAVPYYNDFRILNYNQEHLDSAQITELPTTWEEYVDTCLKLKAAGIEYPSDIQLSVSEGTTTRFMIQALSAHGPVFNDDNTINHDVVLATMQDYYDMIFVHEIINPASTNLIDQEITQEYLNGVISFVLGGPGAIYDNDSTSQIVGKGGMSLIPSSIEGKASVSYGLPGAVGISAYSDKKEAARTFVEWYTSLSGDSVARHLLATQGIMPTRSTLMAQFGEEGLIVDGEVVSEQSKYVTSLFPNGIPVWYAEYSTAMANEINALAMGQITPEQATANIEAAVAALIAAE